jgi:hypothetical protein
MDYRTCITNDSPVDVQFDGLAILDLIGETPSIEVALVMIIEFYMAPLKDSTRTTRLQRSYIEYQIGLLFNQLLHVRKSHAPRIDSTKSLMRLVDGALPHRANKHTHTSLFHQLEHKIFGSKSFGKSVNQNHRVRRRFIEGCDCFNGRGLCM